MNDFLEKWKSDKRYRAKIKLIAYTLFVVIVSIYAMSLNSSTTHHSINEIIDEKSKNNEDTQEEIIKEPTNYNYSILINIDDNNYKYYGTKNDTRKTIIKEKEGNITNYIYENNEYYLEDNINIDNYIKTTKEEVYDIINYNYIDIKNINAYLNKAVKNGNQYSVYLKDVILGNNSENYFVILINNNKISIDYTPLMKEFNNNIKKYKVDIELEEIE